MNLPRSFGIWLLALLAWIPPAAHAQTPHETFIWDGIPSLDQVAQWSALPGTRSYLFQNADPMASDIAAFAQLRGADGIEVEVSRYPGEGEVAAWQRIAGLGVELVGFSGDIPTDDEVQRLNRCGFSRYVFVLTGYPGPEEAARLARLQGSVSVTFAVTRYPLYQEKDSFLAIPASVPLLFSEDYWPWYSHMDLFNMLPQVQRLRVSGSFPPSDELQYLRNIHRLKEVVIETDFDSPEAGDWDSFGQIPVMWSSKDRVPTPEGLAAFEKSALLGTHMPRERRLTIDMDRDLTSDERALLERSPLPVEWIHAAPTDLPYRSLTGAALSLAPSGARLSR